MVLNTNLSAIFASRQEGINVGNSQNSAEKLASGMKINRAKDDSSGLAISEKMRSQIRGLNRASKNVGDVISFTNTTDGYLSETQDILQRIRELSVQAGNGIYSDESRMHIQVEVSQLVSEIDRIASQASFNGLSIFTGRFAKGTDGMSAHIGPNMDEKIQLFVGTMTSQALGLKGTQGTDEIISVETAESANRAIGTLDEALKKVATERADIGAITNRAEFAQKGIDIASENLQASDSRIRDTDYAKEIVESVKNQILTQSSTALIAQANNNSSNVLSLLR